MEGALQVRPQTRVVRGFPIPGGEPADAAAPRARPSRSLRDIVVHHLWLIVGFTAVVVAAVALWSYTTTPVYEATAVLQIDPERPGVVAFTGMPSELAPQEDIRFNERVFEAYYNTQYERLRSPSLLARVEATLDLDHHPAFRSGFTGLESYISVSPVKRSRMVQVTARVADPALAAAIPNRVASEYVQTARQEGRAASEAARQWLEGALVRLRLRSDEAGSTRPTADPYAVAAAVGGELLRTLKADLSRLEREAARARTVYGPQHPKMVELEAELDNAKERLDTEVSSELVKRLKELELSTQQRVANIKVIDPAVQPRKPVRPNHPRDLMLALTGGLVGGLVLAFLRELSDTTLRSAREADLIMQLPSVGTVPAIRAVSGYTRLLPLVNDLPRALRGDAQQWPEQVAREAFRSIRAIVLNRGAAAAPRTLLVTSAQPSEGKSLVAVNLAVALAKTGHPVLLIDGDFHQPVCHHAFGLELPSAGLSTLLARGGAPASVIVPTGFANLSFLPTGPRPADPAALLSSERVTDLLDNLKDRYRWIVIDSPPVLPASDASVVAPIVDGVLLVVRAHATPVEAAWVARDRLELLGAKILGVVLNDVRLTRDRYFYANYS